MLPRRYILSTMLTLLSLPEEIAFHVLALLEPLDVRSCRQVCRKFNTLVTTSPRLLFSLALESLGYTLPAVSRPNLGPSESLKLLQKHYSNWLRPNSIQPTRHSLCAHSATSKYAGGVYAQGFGTSGFLGTNANIRGLEFYQLPSKNLDVEFRRWRLEEMDPGVQDFVFDPDQDLLALLELPNTTTQYSATYKVHLRTMTKGEVHPRATVQTIVANFTEEAASNGMVPNWSYHFEVLGQLLGILFRSRFKEHLSWVIIWDWVRGIEITRVSTAGGWHSSFVLLNQETLLLPRSGDSCCTRRFFKNDSSGSIEVHVFDSKTNVSIPPRMVSSFSLPSLGQEGVESTLKLRCTPNVRPTYQPQGRPKVYETYSDYPLVDIDVYSSRVQGLGQISESAGTLYVPGSVFLDASYYTQETSVLYNIINKIYARSVLEVPWSKWASRTSWVDPGNSRTNGDCLMHGYRMGSLSNRVRIRSPASRIHLLDFNQHRLKMRGGRTPPAQNRISGEYSLGSVFGKGGSANLEYAETVLEVEDGVDIFDEVILDDEHVIIIRKGEPAGEPFLLTYNF